MKSKTIVLVSSLLVSGFAYAECPSSMSQEESIKCNEIEKSGQNYQNWKSSQENLANESTKSPITGKDVRSMTPAAGNEKSMPAEK